MSSPTEPQAEAAPKPVVPRDQLYAFALVTTLFALWGFANDLTNPMVKAFKDVFLISNFQSSLVQSAFYGGYATMAIPAALVIRKFSFKAGILAGLLLYAIGALLFIPAAASMQFQAFLVCFLVMTCGLAFLETSANPFILAMGPEETATRRLNLAQAFNPMGSLTGMFVASQLVLPSLAITDFRDTELASKPEYTDMSPAEADTLVSEALVAFANDEPEEHAKMQSADLAVIQKPYVAIALVVLAVLLVFALSPMPQAGTPERPIALSELAGRLAHFRYVGGVIAQAFYVGAQIMCWTFIIHYGMTLLGLSAAEAQRYNIAAMVLFVVGRFVCTLVFLRYMRPERLLMALAGGAALLTVGTIFLRGYAGLYCLIGVSGCMSLMFPTIYGIALKGLSIDDAKLGSAGLIFAIVGGALMPSLQALVIDSGPVTLGGTTLESVRVSFFLPLLCFVVVATYGLLAQRSNGPTHPLEKDPS